MTDEIKNNKEQQIEKEFLDQILEVRSSIERIGIRQDEIKSYIFDVSSIIDNVKMQIESAPANAYEAKAKLYLVVQKNTELIAKFYDSISNFESVRHRYQQDISRLTKDKLQFINIDLKRIEDKTMEAGASVSALVKELKDFVTVINEKPEQVNKIMASIENDPAYSME